MQIEKHTDTEAHLRASLFYFRSSVGGILIFFRFSDLISQCPKVFLKIYQKKVP